MTFEESMCWRIAATVCPALPPGIYEWPRTWEIVDPPSARFLELLPDYRGGDEMTRKRVEKAGNAVVVAWKQAVAEFRQREVA